MLQNRRENAEKFLEIAGAFPWLRVQREIGQSSWFGFSMVVKPGAPVTRDQLVAILSKHQIDVRPIVAGNFAKNEVLKWFDYSIAGSLTHADEIDRNGLFIGNHHYVLTHELNSLRAALAEAHGAI